MAIVLSIVMLCVAVTPLTALADTSSRMSTQATTTTATSTDMSGSIISQPSTTAKSKTSGTTTTSSEISTSVDLAQLPPVVDAKGQTVQPANWFINLIQSLQLAITYDPAKKAAFVHMQALQKLATVEKYDKARNPEATQNAINEFDNKIIQAQEFLEQVKDPNSEKAMALESALVQVTANNIQILNGLLTKLPPLAAKKVALNIVRSMERVVNNQAKHNKNDKNTSTNKQTEDQANSVINALNNINSIDYIRKDQTK